MRRIEVLIFGAAALAALLDGARTGRVERPQETRPARCHWRSLPDYREGIGGRDGPGVPPGPSSGGGRGPFEAPFP